MSLPTPNQWRTYLWIQVCEQLKWHNKGSHSCIDTLNRLWRKHPDIFAETEDFRAKMPVLTESMLEVRPELWSLQELLSLKDERHHPRDQPAFFPPILVLRCSDRNFLIDGGTRINFWRKHSNVGPHAVLGIVQVDQ